MNEAASPSLVASPALAKREDAQVIALVSSAHLISHFSQLLLPPLFPWLKEAFGASYAELGFLVAVFFGVSCAVQTLSGFLVDRYGPRPVLLGGLALLTIGALGYAASQSYSMLMFFVLISGLGNGVFHPVDYTLINRRVSSNRLGHAYSAHGISGNLGWATAPALLVPLAMASSWRHAILVGAFFMMLVLLALWFNRRHLLLPPSSPEQGSRSTSDDPGIFSFLHLPAVWISFSFFLFVGIALGIVQAFAPEAARQLHGTPIALVAFCLSAYMLTAAVGMVLAGFLAADPIRSERMVALGYAGAACISFSLALAPLPAYSIPALFGLLGFANGIAGPARDYLIKRATPPHASGRVYGVIYAGLDIGQAVSPLLFAWMMDARQYAALFLGMAVVQLILVLNARRMMAYVRL